MGKHDEDRAAAQRRAETLRGAQSATQQAGQQSGPASDTEAQRRAGVLRDVQSATRHKR